MTNRIDGGNAIPNSLQKLSPQEVATALRSFGLPVRLFGETTTTGGDANDAARLARLYITIQGREVAMAGWQGNLKRMNFVWVGDTGRGTLFLMGWSQ